MLRTHSKITSHFGFNLNLSANSVNLFLSEPLRCAIIDINKLLSPEKQQAIEKELAVDHNNSLKEVKNALGGDCFYEKNRMMLACRKHLESE